ncbi:hypothetical protein ACEWY4_024582 [Coilia grayii]|uniref:DNA-directed DNA polymerase n=1 Tax=Coilia grayii TaxID=363190 RepID=A0ABD1IV33_9TELE
MLAAMGDDMHRRAGFTPQQKIGFSDVAVFERLYDVKIVIFYRSDNGMIIKYQTTETLHDKTAFLYLHDQHYYHVIKPHTFLGNAYFCRFCYESYNNKLTHKCAGCCNVCYGNDCRKRTETSVYCIDCNRYCKSRYCYNTHKQVRQSGPTGRLVAPCDVTKYCKKCNRRYYIAADKKPHKCQAMQCVHCNAELVPEADHCCFIQPIKAKKLETKYIFFDLETRHENGRHRANFACAMTYSGETFVAEGSDCVVRMLTHFRRAKYTGYTWLAHNAAGFDNIIILEHFCNMGVILRITMMGCRLIFMYDEIFKQRFIDSYSFIPMRLAKTTEALSLETSEKGYFPHRFNTAENNNYRGAYPARHYYGYEVMTDKERVAFDAWYVEASKNEFDFQKELYTYGRNDVVLLREACIKYRQEFINCTGLDPFAQTTLASCCMAVYKTHYLPADTLALTHNNAYVNQHKAYSNISIQWLEFLKFSRNVDVQHALNRGEVQVGRYHIDGFYEKDGVKHALEFNGCLFHGHKCRHNPNNLHPLSKVPYSVLIQHFEDKVAYLTNEHGFNAEVMWECQWIQAKKNNADVIHFMSTYAHPERLKPRQSLFGGRTNAYKLYYKTKEGEKIRYIDFTSLYPACQSKNDYPINNPQIILKDFQPLENYFGIIKATVAPPRGLLHPVLPYRCKNKLMFPLCRTCAEQENQTPPCTHSDAERCLSGCWVSIELQRAMEKGYVVTKVDEVWHFTQRSDTLFSGYVKTFLQYKQEASGYPAHAVTDDEKKAYIQDYFEKEGIRLNPDKICVNPAKRGINKLLLSSGDAFLCVKISQIL